MAVRKRRIIDRRLQLKTTFSVICITTIAFLVLIAFVSMNATNNNREIKSTITELNRAVEAEDSTVKSFLLNSKNSNISRESYRNKIAEDHDRLVNAMMHNIELLNKFVRQNLQLITFIIVLVMVLGIILYFYLIQITHRIAGPIYVISRYVDDIIAGNEPEFRDLREKDEFKEFHDSFIKMAELIELKKGEDK